MSVELRLLGHPVVCVGGQEVTLPTRKALALLAYLALAGPTSRARMADLLWSDLGEEVGRKNLRQELHRLQASVGSAALMLTTTELRLSPEVQSDVADFQQAVAQERWSEALRVYRGPLLDGLLLRGAANFDEWLCSVREGLGGAYQRALRQMAVQEEAGGDLRGALEHYRTLLKVEPFEEHAYRQAMRLHALLGEREAALELYTRCREMLRREFALEPLQETQDLAGQIRRAASLPVKQVQEPPLPGAPQLDPPLVGRETELERLRTAWQRGVPVFLTGEAGVGKSRLAREFAATQGEYYVMTGVPGDRHVPFASVARQLRQLLRGRGIRFEPWEEQELSRILPELLEQPLPPMRGEYERLRLFDAISEALRRALNDVALVICEDIHLYDLSSNEHGLYNLSKPVQAGQLGRMLGTFRGAELAPPIAERLYASARAGYLEIIELQPLSEVGVAELLSRLAGQPVMVFPRRIFQATGGNPFFILETLRGLFESGELRVNQRGVWETDYDEATQDYRELPIPQTVRSAVLERVQRLGAASLRLLEAASLLGDGFRLADLSGVTALSEWEVVDTLEEVQQAGLIRSADEGEGTVCFAHDLIRRALEEHLAPERRKLLHRRLAAHLEKMGAAPARIAGHLERASLPVQAAHWWVMAGDAALQVYANRDAYRHFSQALSLLPRTATGRFELLGKHELLAYDLGEREAEAQDLTEMQALAVTEPERGRVALRRYALLSISGQPVEAHLAAEQALALFTAAQEAAGMAVSLFHLAEADYYREDFATGLQRASAAKDLIRLHHPEMYVRACNLLAFYQGARGELEAALDAYAEALVFLQEQPNPVLEARTLNNRASLQRSYGLFGAGLKDVNRALEITRMVGLKQLEAFALETRIRVLHGLGRLDEAWADLEIGLARARKFQSARLTADFLRARAGLLTGMGQHQAALEAAAEALQASSAAHLNTNVVLTLAARATALLHLGRPAEALQDASRAYEQLEAQGGMRENLPESVRLVYLQALLGTGHQPECQALLPGMQADLLACAERIGDRHLRQTYLKLKVNQDLLSLRP